uniref:Uncharacterized protein n=1 Tax=Ditylenchus dipsaci TaxID=166011 RepID=A0A915DY64_9BILA
MHASGSSRRGAARLALANVAAMPPKPIIRPSIIVKDSCFGPELSKEMLREMLKPIQIGYPAEKSDYSSPFQLPYRSAAVGSRPTGRWP